MNWSHHPNIDTVKDDTMKKAGADIVSFVFTCDVEGKEIEPEEPENENVLDQKPARRHTVLGIRDRRSGLLNERPLSVGLSKRLSLQIPQAKRSTIGLGKRKTENGDSEGRDQEEAHRPSVK